MTKTLQRPGGQVGLIYLSTLLGNANFQAGLWIIYLTQSGLSLLQVGVLQAVLSVTVVTVELPGGSLADHLGRKPTVIAGRLCVAAYMLVMLAHPSVEGLAIGFAVYGAGMAFVSGAETALLLDVREQSAAAATGSADDLTVDTSRVVGRYFALITISMAVGLALGGLLQRLGWEWVFAASAVTQLLAAAALLPVRERSRRTVDAETEAHEQLVGLRASVAFLWSQPRTLALVGAMALYTGIVSVVYMLGQPLLEAAGAAVASIALLYAFEACLGALGAAQAHRVQARFGLRLGLLSGTAVTIALLAGLSSPIALLVVVGFSALGAVDNVMDTLGQTALVLAAPERIRASVLSLLSMSASAVMAIAMPLFGLADQHAQLGGAVFLLGVAAMSIVAILCVISTKNLSPLLSQVVSS